MKTQTKQILICRIIWTS